MQKCLKVRHSALTFFALKSCFSCFWTLKMSEKRVILGVQKRPFWGPLFHPLFRTYSGRVSMVSMSLSQHDMHCYVPLGSRHVSSHDGIFGTWQNHEKPWKIMLKTWFFRVFPVLPIPGKRVFCKIRKVQSQKCSKVPHSSLTLFH